MSELQPAPGASVGRRRSPVHQILTLFGDYWLRVDEPLPTGAILSALADLGVKGPAARAALVRLTERGLLEPTKSGRRTSHALTAQGDAIILDEARWLRGFGRDDPEWDGEWSAIFFSIPETERPLRHAARTRLRWLGYAPLYDGVWISPFDTADEARAALAELGVFDASSLRGPLRIASGDAPTRAWDLGPVRDAYDELLAQLASDSAADLEEATTSDAAARAFARRMSLMLTWQAFRQGDPGHPLALLPDGWPRPAARAAFVAAYDALGPAAEDRMRAHIADISPDLARRVTSQRLG